MRPVSAKYATTQGFGSMKTGGVVGNINAPMDTVEYWVGRYGNYQEYGHAGEDIGCPVGTPVYAMDSGTVLWADWGTNLPGDESDWGYRQRWYLYKGFPGIVTVIQHPGWIGIYAHLSDNDAAPRGSVVKKGQLIGHSGDTGGVDAHLHREALVDLSYRTGGGLIYGRTDPTIFDGGIAAQGSITPEDLGEFLMSLTEQQQKDIYWQLCTEEGRNAAAERNAKAVLKYKVPLSSGGDTSLETKVTYMKQEFDATQNLTKALRDEVAKLTAAVAALSPKES